MLKNYSSPIFFFPVMVFSNPKRKVPSMKILGVLPVAFYVVFT